MNILTEFRKLKKCSQKRGINEIGDNVSDKIERF